MVLLRTWQNIYDYFKGDKDKLFTFTLGMLLLTEIPIWLFTALDLLALPSLLPYRLHYTNEVSAHLGNRVYPPWSVIKKTMKVAEFNLLFAYLVPGYLAIKAANAMKIYVYDFDRESLSYWRLIKETFLITFVADFMFYWIHRFLHEGEYYAAWHKMHHEYKYSIALAHHWMTYHEAMMFSLPQSLPPILLIPFIGKSHIMSMWAGMWVTQLCGIFGHAGWNFVKIPDWFPLFNPAFHDYHHVEFYKNYAASYTWTDKIFGTFAKSPVADKAEVMARLAVEKAHDYATHAIEGSIKAL